MHMRGVSNASRHVGMSAAREMAGNFTVPEAWPPCEEMHAGSLILQSFVSYNAFTWCKISDREACCIAAVLYASRNSQRSSLCMLALVPVAVISKYQRRHRWHGICHASFESCMGKVIICRGMFWNIGSRPSDHYFRSVCWFVCLSVCLFVCLFVQSFSQPS